jgi:hypothetical protein
MRNPRAEFRKSRLVSALAQDLQKITVEREKCFEFIQNSIHFKVWQSAAGNYLSKEQKGGKKLWQMMSSR